MQEHYYGPYTMVQELPQDCVSSQPFILVVLNVLVFLPLSLYTFYGRLIFSLASFFIRS